jgi:hypothetical protein
MGLLLLPGMLPGVFFLIFWRKINAGSVRPPFSSMVFSQTLENFP